MDQNQSMIDDKRILSCLCYQINRNKSHDAIGPNRPKADIGGKLCRLWRVRSRNVARSPHFLLREIRKKKTKIKTEHASSQNTEIIQGAKREIF